MRRRRGFTYLELLAAITVLGLAILAGSGLLVRYRWYLARLDGRANDVVEAQSELARIRTGALPPIGRRSIVSGTLHLSGEVDVRPEGSGLRRITVRLRDRNGKPVVAETIVRSDP